jgi:peptidoglycan/xylan/chitin deacetylase (PgdA/CDA1 family)
MKMSLKNKLKAVAATGVSIAVITIVVFLNTAYVVPVMMYHSIDDQENVTKLSVSPETFELQMAFLHKHKYNVVSLDKVISYLEKKEKIPARTVAITFDDGFYNNYKYAYPVLKKYNFPATLFMITSKIGQDGWCGWKELKEMSDSGLITIGSHTVNHKWLPTMGTEQLKRELADSKAALENGLGKKVDYLCYPIGAHDDRVERLTKEAGYKAAVATNPGRISPEEDVYAIKRIKISRTARNPVVLWFETSGYYTWFKENKDDY